MEQTKNNVQFMKEDGHATYAYTSAIWNMLNKSDRKAAEGFLELTDTMIRSLDNESFKSLSPLDRDKLKTWYTDIRNVCDEWLINDDCAISSLPHSSF